MARPPREEVAGGVFHICARGNNKELIFRDDRDCERYLDLLAQVAEKMNWRVLSYCLMRNHVHLLVKTMRPNLGEGMRWFHGDYAQRFNKRHGRVGHVFQGRYKPVRQRADEQLLATLRYIALNPVESGLVVRPELYRWNSHAVLMRGSAPPCLDARELLSYFGDSIDRAVERYRAFASGWQAELGAKVGV